VRKPMLSRQGANVEILIDGQIHYKSEGPYGDNAHIVQGFQSLPEYGGYFPLVGCWMIAGKTTGLCIREDKTLVTSKGARFVPHLIID